MSTADPDGRIAQALTDRLTCLGMELHESVRAATEALEQALGDAQAVLDAGAAYDAAALRGHIVAGFDERPGQ